MEKMSIRLVSSDRFLKAPVIEAESETSDGPDRGGTMASEQDTNALRWRQATAQSTGKSIARIRNVPAAEQKAENYGKQKRQL
jgi:hypothetical protein